MGHTQWYRINTNEILENHKLALCKDTAVHMVPIPPAEPLEANTFKTIARLTFSQAQNEHINSPNKQPMYSNSTSANQITNHSPQNNVHPHKLVHCYLTVI